MLDPRLLDNTRSAKHTKLLMEKTKSLLIPDSSDFKDAHSHKDHDEIYNSVLDSRYELPWRFSHVKGMFRQTVPEIDDMKFNYVFEDFGVITDWDDTVKRLRKLNKPKLSDRLTLGKKTKTKYKLLLLGRHGEGFHNLAARKYKGKEWIDKWRFLGTDGVINWGPDPELTEKGKLQAAENEVFLKSQLLKGMPIPSKFFVSPLKRSVETMFIEWEGLVEEPMVVESLRETIGMNLCHKRSKKSIIQQGYPSLSFEQDFPEDDVLDTRYSHEREMLWQQFIRINLFLQDIFGNKLGVTDEDEVISITCHAGTIRAFITVVGHRNFTIPKGGMIPILVKAESN